MYLAYSSKCTACTDSADESVNFALGLGPDFRAWWLRREGKWVGNKRGESRGDIQEVFSPVVS